MFKNVVLIAIAGIALGGCSLLPGASENPLSGGGGDSFTGSLRELVSLGKEFECTTTVEGVVSTSYIKGERFYSEAETPEGMVKSIMKDNCTWSWVEGQAQGFTLCFDPSEAGDYIDTEGEVTEIWDWDNEYVDADVDYNCKAAKVDAALFTPPANVTFTDMQNLLPTNLPAQDFEAMDAEAQEFYRQAMEQLGQ
jgi:hypothetical protein